MSYLLPPLQGDFVVNWGSVSVNPFNSVPLLPANAERCFFAANIVTGNPVYCSPDPNVNSSGGVFSLQGSGVPTLITWQEWAILTTFPWYAISSSGTNIVHWVQVLWRPTGGML